MDFIHQILRQVNFYYGPFLLTSIPIVSITWLLTRKTIIWRFRELLIFLGVPALWFFLTFSVNSRKTLGNVAIEPLLLGGIIGILFILSIFISKRNEKLKFPFLVIASILSTILMQLLFPILRE